MSTLDQVKKVVTELRIVNKDGTLNQIDSMGLIDLVVALEGEFALSIPPEQLVPDHFVSVDSLGSFMQHVIDTERAA